MDQLIITNLSKTYANGVRALQNVNLNIPTGLFGLLGPNGAGKSTLMRTIATLQQADEGSITLGDINVLQEQDRVRRILGYMPQEFGLYPTVTAEALLYHFAALKGILKHNERNATVAALLHKTNLYQHRKKKLGGFSGGMKRRFGIAQALLANPRLLIVDEPTAGLDPAERHRFHKLLCELGEQTIVILSTHIVEDVKELCKNMAIIHQGQVLMQGHPMSAITELEDKVYRKTIPADALAHHQQNYHVISERLTEGQPVIHIYSEHDPGDGFQAVAADLNDVYFYHLSDGINPAANV